MANDIFGNFQEAVWNAIRSAVRVGVVGRANSDGTTTIVVPGRDHYIYVRTGATQTGGEILEAYNKGIPRLAGAPCLLIKWNRVWTVVGVDADSPAVTTDVYSVAYHTHKRDNGLNQSVHDLDGMPSTVAGRAGALLRVNDDEDGYYLADADTGDIGVGATINAAAADTPLDADKFGYWDVVDAALKSITWQSLRGLFITFTNKIAIAATATTGAALRVVRDLAAASTDSPVVDIVQDNAGDDQAALRVQQDGTGAALEVYDGATLILRARDGGILDVAQIVRALTASGLRLEDDGGNLGIFVEDGGDVGIGHAAPIADLHVHETKNGGRTVFFISNAGTGNAQAGFRAGLSASDDTTNYVAMDVLGSGFGTFGIVKALSALLEGNAGNFIISNLNASEPLIFATGSSRTGRMWITSVGRVGIGTSAPQGIHHVYDGTSGWLKVTKPGVDGTAQTIIPDGTGDVTKYACISAVGTDSVGGVAQRAQTFLQPGGTTTVATAANTATVTVNANGSVTVQRTVGTGTMAITLDMFWQ